MALYLLVAVLLVIWLSLGLWALNKVNKILRKYRNIKQVQYPPQWQAFVRRDFNKWDESNIKAGCFLRFPFKFMGLICLLVNLVLMVYLKKISPAIGSRHEALVVVLGGYFLGLLFKYDQKFTRQKIASPIIISNHTCWFDIFYLAEVCYAVSFVSKAEVQKIPIVRTVANYLQTVWLDRKNADARDKILQVIKGRIQAYNREPSLVNPLLIFPQGTTSNGRSIMRFKIGAFNDRAKITMFGLQYQCKGFQMGMQEVTDFQHVIISLSLSPKLTVHKIVMESLENQSAQEYMGRCQQELSKLTGYRIYDAGFTEKCRFKQMRYGKKQN